jgi:hypothetical protein
LDDNASAIQNMVDRSIKARASTDFAENRGGNPHERTPFVRHSKDGPGPFGEHSTLGRPGERIECLRVEN